MKHITQLDVFMAGTRVGGLAMDARGVIWFAYDPSWVENGQPLSPMKQFALSTTPFKASSAVFDQLHGVFNDALPDGWGLLLMDRYLKAAAGWSAHEITPLDRLAYIGARAMGALEFRPVIKHHETQTALSLDRLAEEALLVQEGSAADVLSALYLYGGSPGGARPKVTVAMERGGAGKLASQALPTSRTTLNTGSSSTEARMATQNRWAASSWPMHAWPMRPVWPCRPLNSCKPPCAAKTRTFLPCNALTASVISGGM